MNQPNLRTELVDWIKAELAHREQIDTFLTNERDACTFDHDCTEADWHLDRAYSAHPWTFEASRQWIADLTEAPSADLAQLLAELTTKETP